MPTAARPIPFARSTLVLLLTAALPALAQETTQRIEITGSSIKRIDAETALPVQVITRSDIQKSGATNVEQLMQTVSAAASSGAFASSASSGAATGSLSSISLRGLSSLRTLVLLNGRRIAPYGVGFVGDSVSVDVNSIPISAIDRVEILKDGASAIYGSDAVAGVVNFILRRDFNGGELALDAGNTHAGGANNRRASITAGFGDLARDRYNVMLSAALQKEGALFGRERDFATRGYDFAANNNGTSFHSFPANVFSPDFSIGGNPSAPTCPAPYAINTPFDDGTGFCSFDPSPLVTLLPGTERVSVMAAGRFALSASTELFAEASFTKSKQRVVIQPVPFSFAFALPGSNPLNGQAPWNGLYPAEYGALAGTPHGLGASNSLILLRPGTPYYPTAFVQSLLNPGDPLPPLTVFYRSNETGNRDITDHSEAPRLVLGARGTAGDWDWETAVLRSQSKVREQVNGGYPANSRILPILNSGRVNFFGPNTPDVAAELRATNFLGDAFKITSTLTSVSAKASRELGALGGGKAGLALGAEFRREDYLFDPNPTIQTGDISGYGGNFLTTDRSRRVDALFGEINLPLAKSLEVNVATRFDRYEGVGNSTTPKASLRWQPLPEVVRVAVGKGFRAPSLQDLYLPQTTGVTAAGLSDPLRCPPVVLPPGQRTDCSAQFNVIFGGNPELKPEKSSNATLGIVLSPTPQLTVGIDAFRINVEDTIINGITPAIILGNLDAYGFLVTRGPIDPSTPGLPGPIVQINQTNINLGEIRVAGVDLDLRFSAPLAGGKLTLSGAGTYFSKYDVQNLDGSFASGLDAANAATGGVIVRWKHHASIDWSHGPWGFTLGQSWQKGYNDLAPSGGTPLRRVGVYELYDLQARYTGFKNLELRAGIRNLFDKDPPYSNAGSQTSFQGGYDAQYADPRGRFFYAGLTYKFF
jgi:iron complex outermembrane recepter protein